MKKLMLILLIAACTVPKHGPPNPNSIMDAAQIDSLAKAFHYIEGSGDNMPMTVTEMGTEYMPDQWHYPPQWTNRYPTGIDTVYIHDTIYRCPPDTVWDHGISAYGGDTIIASIGLLSTTTTGILTFDSLGIIHDHYYDSMTARKIYKDSMVKIYGKDFKLVEVKPGVIQHRDIWWGLIASILFLIIWFVFLYWVLKKTESYGKET